MLFQIMAEYKWGISITVEENIIDCTKHVYSK